jgi:signal transduction histidine kinase
MTVSYARGGDIVIVPPAYPVMAEFAHDLRNYLQIALSAIHIMVLNRDEPAELERIAAHAQDAIERAGALLRRPQDSAALTQADETSVETCLTQIVPMLRYVCGSDISIELRIGLVPKVRCNPLGLQNALLNLVLNAREAMPAGGALTISADVVEGPEAAEVEIAVSDNGLGMAPATLRRAFEPFFSTKPTGPGRGMGLAGVRSFVEDASGRVHIESVQNVGTSVMLRLPIALWPALG